LQVLVANAERLAAAWVFEKQLFGFLSVVD
jgi:hypothetical protein